MYFFVGVLLQISFNNSERHENIVLGNYSLCNLLANHLLRTMKPHVDYQIVLTSVGRCEFPQRIRESDLFHKYLCI